MKHASLVMASLAGAALASCGSQGSDNLSMNVQAVDNAVLGNEMVEPANVAAEAPAIEPVNVPQASPPEPPARARPVREPAQPAPRPKPKAEAPPVDPHAGHDMGNMANMQH